MLPPSTMRRDPPCGGSHSVSEYPDPAVRIPRSRLPRHSGREDAVYVPTMSIRVEHQPGSTDWCYTLTDVEPSPEFCGDRGSTSSVRAGRQCTLSSRGRSSEIGAKPPVRAYFVCLTPGAIMGSTVRWWTGRNYASPPGTHRTGNCPHRHGHPLRSLEFQGGRMLVITLQRHDRAIERLTRDSNGIVFRKSPLRKGQVLAAPPGYDRRGASPYRGDRSVIGAGSSTSRGSTQSIGGARL